MQTTLYKRLRRCYIDWLRPGDFSLREVKYLGAHFLVLAHEDVGWRLIRRKTYEEREIKCIQRLIRTQDTCIDVGANIGIFSVMMARKASQGRIVSFDPIPLNQKILALNAEINNCHNIEIMDKVVSDSEGEIEFTVMEDGSYSSIAATDRKRTHAVLTKQATTLDKVFADGPDNIGGIKIDVEGAELLVLRGGKRLLEDTKKRPRFVLAEICAQNEEIYGYSPDDVLEFMRLLNYEPFSITPTGVVEGWPREGGSENVLFLHPDSPRPGLE